MIKTPKVSIVIPVYNVEHYLSRCLSSVINQTLYDIEIICVNDGSSDNSIDVINSYARRDNRIFIIDKKNQGVASARNTGLKNASGKLIMFLDPDDYLEYNACERVYEEFLNHEADIIVFGSKPFPENLMLEDWILLRTGSRDVLYEYFEPNALFDERGGYPFVWNRGFSSDFLKEKNLWFDEDVPFGEDMIFIFEITPMASKIQFISDKLHNYRVSRPDSIMHEFNAVAEKKMTQHIVNLEKITRFWHERGFIERWGSSFLKFFVEFSVTDLERYELKNKKELACRLASIMKKNGLLQCVKKADVRTRNKVRQLLNIIKTGK